LQTPYKLPCWNQTKIEILQLTPDSNEEEEGWTVYKEEEFAQKNKNDEQNREEERLKPLQENLHIPTDTLSDGKLNRGYRYHKTVGIEFCGFCKLLPHEFCWYRILKISHVYPKNFFLLFFCEIDN
jgi:hypothetical protein